MPRHKNPSNEGLPVKIDIDKYDLPELTEQEVKFCMLMVQGKGSQADIYKEAFSAHHWSDNAASVQASRLKNKPEIKSWIAAMQIEAVKQGGIKHAEYNIKLMELAEEARQKGQWGAVTGLMTTLGKSMGFFSERVTIKDERQELADQVKRLDKISPEVSGLIKKQFSHYLPDLNGEVTKH